jgi:hypothetical protein
MNDPSRRGEAATTASEPGSPGDDVAAPQDAALRFAREVVGQASEGDADGASLEALLARVEAAVAREAGVRGRLRCWPAAARSALAVGTALLGSVALYAWVFPSHAAIPGVRLALELSLFAAALVAAVSLTLRPAWRTAPSRPVARFAELGWLVAGLAVAAWPTAFVEAVYLDFEPETGWVAVRHGLVCAGLGGAVALLTLGALRLVDRHEHAPLTAYAAAAVAGQLAQRGFCVSLESDHLLASHVGIGVALFLLGIARGAFPARFGET